MLYISKPNKKLKATGQIHNMLVLSFDLPVIKTCPFAGECKKGCYANAGLYIMPDKIARSEGNYNASKCKTFVKDVEICIRARMLEYGNTKCAVRMHTSGDFYTKAYMSKWIQVARKMPDVLFYGYTKSVRWYHELKPSMPDNFVLTLSYGGKQDDEIRDDDKVSKVFATEMDCVEAGYDIRASHDDLTMLVSDRMGLVYHGNYGRKWETTGWYEKS